MLVKRIAKWLSCLLVPALLAACAGGGSRDGAGGNEKAPNSNEPVELIFYSNAETGDVNFNAKYGDYIRKKFPHYTITSIPNKKGSSLPELLAQGTAIDIYYESVGQFVEGLINSNLQYDMTDLIKKHKVD